MATIKQVLLAQDAVDRAQVSLQTKCARRNKLIAACPELSTPPYHYSGPTEVFATVDGVPCRIKVWRDGDVVKEELRF
jgi:hypothetical protein